MWRIDRGIGVSIDGSGGGDISGYISGGGVGSGVSIVNGGGGSDKSCGGCVEGVDRLELGWKGKGWVW